MKIAIGMVAAVLFAGLACAQTAQAQSTPQGSYLRSCAGAHVEGGALVARCQRDDGRENRSILADVGGCRGDIANVNGQLVCRDHGGPPPAYGSAAPPPGRDSCAGLHREARDIRDRMAATINPLERMSLEGQLRDVRAQEDRCGR